MRLALLSDIHGNSIALDAVLQDIDQRGGVDGYWVLGDLVALGHDPVGVLERLHALPNAQFVRGNTDRNLVEPMGGVSAEKETFTPTEVNAMLNRQRTFAWTLGCVYAAGYYDWLAQLPLELRLTLPDGSRLLGVHASPGKDDGPGLKPNLSDTIMRQRLAGADADIVCVGHTHFPMNLFVDDVHLINISPVNITPPADKRAKYVILEADENGYTLTHFYVNVDWQKVEQAFLAAHHPAAGQMIKILQMGAAARWAAKMSDKDIVALIPEAGKPFGKHNRS